VIDATGFVQENKIFFQALTASAAQAVRWRGPSYASGCRGGVIVEVRIISGERAIAWAKPAEMASPCPWPGEDILWLSDGAKGRSLFAVAV